MEEEISRKIREIALHYGWKRQSLQAVEELSELQKAVCKYLRFDAKKDSDEWKSLVEELADVRIMTEQLQDLLECGDEVETEIETKVERQLGRITSEEGISDEERLLLYGSDKRFGIYQIRDGNCPYLFMGKKFLDSKGIVPNGADYGFVYSDEMKEGTLNSIYDEFNCSLPESCKGHSLSVSDVIVLNHGESVSAWYVDSIGFKFLPDFVEERMVSFSKASKTNSFHSFLF